MPSDEQLGGPRERQSSGIQHGETAVDLRGPLLVEQDSMNPVAVQVRNEELAGRAERRHERERSLRQRDVAVEDGGASVGIKAESLDSLSLARGEQLTV